MTRWLLGGIAAATAIGWVAATCHLSGRAPVGLVSLGVGMALGLVLSRLAAATGVSGQRRLILGAGMLALATVAAEHTWLYRDFRRQWHEARSSDPQVALFRSEEPWTPAEYFQHELSPARVTLWCVDAALVVVAAVATVFVIVWRHQHV